MTFSADKIRMFITDGETEKALNGLIEWLQSINSPRVDEAILLKSQWEHLERDMMLNLISSEEGARRASQINFAVLKLLKEPSQSLTAIKAPPKKINFTFGIAAGIAIVAISLFLIRNSTQKTRKEPLQPQTQQQSVLPQTLEQPSITTDDVVENEKAAIATITFPKDTIRRTNVQGLKVGFLIQKGEIKANPTDPNTQKIILWMRCQVPKMSKIAYLFTTENFRLLADNVTYLPEKSFQAEVLPGRYEGRILLFTVPKEVRSASLRNLSPNLTIPLKWD